MLKIADCIAKTHDPSLVALAGLICLVSAWTTVRLVQRMMAEKERGQRMTWLMVAAAVSGAGVWATHFVAMLAFQPHVALGYEVGTTVLSFLAGVLLTALALLLLIAVPGWWLPRLFAGALLGIATVVMHYTGTAGLQVAGEIVWDSRLILASALLSVLLATPALFCCRQRRQLRRLGVGLLALSVLALHFTGMAAITLVPDPARELPPGLLSGTALGYGVGIVSLMILGCAIASWIIENRLQREHERRLKFLARHDPLTSLPNRALFEEIVTRELTRPYGDDGRAAMLCLDLDGFKEVNDIFGHAAGDELLVEVAVRLQRLLGERCVAARLGGDEFAILATALEGPRSPDGAAQLVLDTLARPFEVDGNQLDIGCSVGVALFPQDGETYQVLMSKADTALGRAKAAGKGVFRFFERSMDEALRERRDLARDLRNGIKTGQFALDYQPQVDIRSGEVRSLEALLRWEHPERGNVPCEAFLPVAEETGLILQIGEWMLREACREAAGWERPLLVAVNLSPAQFRQTGLADLIFSILRETHLAPERLEIEITEGLLLEGSGRALQVLERLKGRGVRIVMDDFGTGQGSLSALQLFPFDKIEVDAAFTTQIGRNKRTAAVLQAVLGLGESLEIPVIAKGVENPAQLAFLREHRCAGAQGPLCGEARPIADYADAVRERPTRPDNVHTLRLA